MSAEISAGVIGLAGALIGGGCTLGAQRAGDRRARGRTAWDEHRRLVAALRLTILDLKRTSQRLARVVSDPRGYTELPRGAWLEYRALLAPRLREEELRSVEDSYNEIIEWNEIIWSAFSQRPPQYFYGAGQHPLDRSKAAELLAEKHESLQREVADAASALGAALEREGGRSEADVARAVRWT